MNINTDDLKNTVKQIWQPALAGAIGSGGLAGYLSAKDNDPAEDPAARRKRIIRNALIGTAFGGAAGAALPLGTKMLTDPFLGDVKSHASLPSRAIGAGAGAVAKNALPLGVGAAGLGWISRNSAAHKRHAVSEMMHRLGGKTSLGGQDIKNDAELGAALRANPGHFDELATTLQSKARAAGEGESASHVFGAHDLLNEAGVRGPGQPTKTDLLKKILGMGGKGSGHNSGQSAALKQFLGSEDMGPVSRGMSKLIPKNVPIAKLKGAMSPEELPELYRRLVRPSIKGRMPLPAQLALLAGGVGVAHETQKHLMGN